MGGAFSLSNIHIMGSDCCSPNSDQLDNEQLTLTKNDCDVAESQLDKFSENPSGPHAVIYYSALESGTISMKFVETAAAYEEWKIQNIIMRFDVLKESHVAERKFKERPEVIGTGVDNTNVYYKTLTSIFAKCRKMKLRYVLLNDAPLCQPIKIYFNTHEDKIIALKEKFDHFDHIDDNIRAVSVCSVKMRKYESNEGEVKSMVLSRFTIHVSEEKFGNTSAFIK